MCLEGGLYHYVDRRSRYYEPPECLVYVAWRFRNALLADGTGPYGRHSGIQPPSNT